MKLETERALAPLRESIALTELIIERYHYWRERLPSSILFIDKDGSEKLITIFPPESLELYHTKLAEYEERLRVALELDKHVRELYGFEDE